ncbi:DUF3224 domain-containing protein [Nocardioides mangrovicus]|uniref:DUF3224 domain-containing protein n=1 Tax=Nocardioides mangrovicus TaxID=2478913 RepID=A0A3L8P890_9ACTN|nr:DUF3224 domain-containing protein [Nocardioides mangrovicus]RLV51237.1 DUF3224 domain-containing protein [Nocardioides mangrovicus]
MQAAATFEVTEFRPVEYTSPIDTGTPVGQAVISKQISGAIQGRSVAQFAGAYDQANGRGSYVALETFEGSIDGRSGTLAFAHTNTTGGRDAARDHHLLIIVPGSGTADLAGIEGTGALQVDDDGTHRLTLDYELG